MIVLQDVSNIVGNVLIDENNSDIFSRTELLKGFFNRL